MRVTSGWRKALARIAVGSVTLAVASALCVGASPAHASGPDIEFSTDGVNYSASALGSLFDDIAFMVPGDSQTHSFWVRNLASTTGTLRAYVTDIAVSSAALADALIVTAHTDSFAGDPVSLGHASPCWVIVEGDRLEPGDVVKVTATLTLGELDGLDGQNSTSSFEVGASLTDAAIGTLPPTSCGGASAPASVSGPPVAIAMTGSEIPYPLLVTGAGALGAGLFLLIAARRRRQEDA